MCTTLLVVKRRTILHVFVAIPCGSFVYSCVPCEQRLRIVVPFSFCFSLFFLLAVHVNKHFPKTGTPFFKNTLLALRSANNIFFVFFWFALLNHLSISSAATIRMIIFFLFEIFTHNSFRTIPTGRSNAPRQPIHNHKNSIFLAFSFSYSLFRIFVLTTLLRRWWMVRKKNFFLNEKKTAFLFKLIT